MNLFYCPEINNARDITLPEEESTHCLRVLRMKRGDVIFLTDGKGQFYEGEINGEIGKKCSVKIKRVILANVKRNFHLTIAIAPTKSIDRFEWFLEKATEIGCDEIIPLSCRHSERVIIKPERLNKVLIAAMKQCLKADLPHLHELTDYKKFIASTEYEKGQKLIGHIPELSEAEFPPPLSGNITLQQVCNKGENILIAIGPEGGFSEEEITLATTKGFTPVSLGNSRLRVETAGVVACSLANAINT